MPNAPRRYYAFDWGPARFTALDSEAYHEPKGIDTPWTDPGEQASFLDESLAFARPRGRSCTSITPSTQATREQGPIWTRKGTCCPSWNGMARRSSLPATRTHMSARTPSEALPVSWETIARALTMGSSTSQVAVVARAIMTNGDRSLVRALGAARSPSSFCWTSRSQRLQSASQSAVGVPKLGSPQAAT